MLGKFVIAEDGKPHRLVIEEAYLELSGVVRDWATIAVSANSDELPAPARLTIKNVQANMNKPFERSVSSLCPDFTLDLFETHPLEDCHVRLEHRENTWCLAFRGYVSGGLSSGQTLLVVEATLEVTTDKL